MHINYTRKFGLSSHLPNCHQILLGEIQDRFRKHRIVGPQDMNVSQSELSKVVFNYDQNLLRWRAWSGHDIYVINVLKLNKKATKRFGGLVPFLPQSSTRVTFNRQSRFKCDPARARTEDPKIKSLLLYQLSYGV